MSLTLLLKTIPVWPIIHEKYHLFAFFRDCLVRRGVKTTVCSKSYVSTLIHTRKCLFQLFPNVFSREVANWFSPHGAWDISFPKQNFEKWLHKSPFSPRVREWCGSLAWCLWPHGTPGQFWHGQLYIHGAEELQKGINKCLDLEKKSSKNSFNIQIVLRAACVGKRCVLVEGVGDLQRSRTLILGRCSSLTMVGVLGSL